MKYKGKLNHFKVILISLFLLLLFQFSFSSQIDASYYADIEIEVSSTGFVTISGISNFEDFQNVQTHKYTSKNGEMWLLNISVDEVFSDYLFRLILPEESIVNYIKTTPNIRFETLNSKLNIVGVGQNRKFELIVQYSFKEFEQTDSDATAFNDIQTVITVILIAILLLFIGFYVYSIRKNSSSTLDSNSLIKPLEGVSNNSFQIKEQYSISDQGTNQSSNQILDKNYSQHIKEKYSYLPSRQQEIISILCEEKQITQKALEKRLNIPKSSVSRNIHSLVIKKIIVKKESGNTNILELHKNVLKPKD